jgi:putative lipase involved disintegration of autophagic bodies
VKEEQMGSSSATHEQLAERLVSFAQVRAKLAIRQVEDGWQLDHALVTVNDPSRPAPLRHWRYASHQFLDLRLPGQLLADLLTGKPQQVDDLLITLAEMVSNALFERLPRHRLWRQVTLPWPITNGRSAGLATMPPRTPTS